MPAPRICYDRVIPASYQPARAAGQTAAMSNYKQSILRKATVSANASPTARMQQHVAAIGALGTLSASDPVHVARMALINLKRWEPGYTLRCRFLDGNDFQKGRVKEKAQIWQEFANINIDFSDDASAEVRISFVADSGSWSAVGNDCLVAAYFPAFQPTMNFGWLRDDTDDDECERVVVHEFGHALGCIHEHPSPNETHPHIRRPH